LWDEHSGPDGERNFLLAADDHSEAGAPTLYNYLQQQRQQKNLLEGTRLLYVGATRAISQLLLTASLTWDEKKEAFRTPSSRCLLSPIWPTFEQQMIVHEPELVPAAVDTLRSVQPLTRLRRDAPPPLPSFTTTGKAALSLDGNIPVRASNHMERSVGTVVHLALEELSLRDALPTSVTEADRGRWSMLLQREGLWGAALSEALDAVASSVNQSLRDGGAGRWVLSPEHEQARSEWALTCADEERGTQDLIIDRTFIDRESGERWLVDYKNSRPQEGETVACFAARETALYRPQLQRYRDALRALGGQPLRCALFFTALGHLHPVTELDLPAVER
jgi:ATP-dependent exoDNAse (exonuclease V) beta subunit